MKQIAKTGNQRTIQALSKIRARGSTIVAGMMLREGVAETIRRYRMFEPGQRVGVAVSGGADSVCLLHLLLELAPDLRLCLNVLHLNHGLRGEESCQDEQFVRDLAARLGLIATVRAVDVAACCGNLEQAARDARLAFFREHLSSGAADRIAVGHTRSDQAETVLFRFLRGAGGAGLAAIRPVTSDGIVRPLLETGRDEVEQYLRERGIPWREDSSNASLQFARNRLRHQLLPQLACEWNPAIGETLSRAADWALAEEEYWEAEIERLSDGRLVERDGAFLVSAEALRELPMAVARRMVRRAVERTKGDIRGIDFGNIAAVLKLASAPAGHGRIQLAGIDVTRSFDWLRFTRRPEDRPAVRGYHLPVPVPGTIRIPGTETAIFLELIDKAETLTPADCVYNTRTGCLDWRSLSGSLELRNWRPGDRYHPRGCSGAEKIKTLFQKARIPRWERCHWPVVTDGSAIVWARHFGPAMRFTASADCDLVLIIRDTGSA
jgi:tRNA(Ile)-lysidine synthase